MYMLCGLYFPCYIHICCAKEADRFTAIPRCRKTLCFCACVAGKDQFHAATRHKLSQNLWQSFGSWKGNPHLMCETFWKMKRFFFFNFTPSTADLLLFFTMTNECTIISQSITLLHVSTLSCHRQVACNQYLAKLHRYVKCSTNFVLWPTNTHNYFTNYHTATCFDTIVSSSDNL